MFWRRKPRSEPEPEPTQPHIDVPPDVSATDVIPDEPEPSTDEDLGATEFAHEGGAAMPPPHREPPAASETTDAEAGGQDPGREPGTSDVRDPPPAADPYASPFVDPAANVGSFATVDYGDLGAGLAKSRAGFVVRLRDAVAGRDADWEAVEETLIAGDVGANLAIDLVARARARDHPDGPEAAIRAELTALLAAREHDWEPRPAAPGQPAVVLVVGVNGTGKTTTIGKLAARYRAEGRSVLLAAADTFRAAAIDQLGIWAERAGVRVIAHASGADPGAVVFDSLDAAVARSVDLVIADTAGRLHTKVDLMDELAKVRRVVERRLPGARPEILFVLDATTGQNGLAQARAFHDATGLTGVVLTKLDSTSKGGIVFAIEDQLGVPVRFVGVGEGIADLVPFDPEAFVAALFA